MADFAAIFLSACLVNNLVLDAMLGLPPALAVSRKIASVSGMSVAMIIMLPAATLITYLFQALVLSPLGLVNLRTICFVLVIMITVKSLEACISLLAANLYMRIKPYVPLTLVNSAVLGTALIAVDGRTGLINSVFLGIGASVGFSLVTIAIAAMRPHLYSMDVPAPFRGLPVTLITLGIMSMAFMGFTGLW